MLNVNLEDIRHADTGDVSQAEAPAHAEHARCRGTVRRRTLGLEREWVSREEGR